MSTMGSSPSYALLVAAAFTFGTLGHAAAKQPGGTHCHGGVCHRVLTIAETAARIGVPTRMYTSHYESCERDPYNPCGLTSSGAEFHAWRADNAASSVYPDGTILLVHSPATRVAVVVRVNNLGPFKGNRLLDVSKATADRLGFAKSGVARLNVAVLKAPTQKETKYQAWRTYAPVPGYIGQYKTLDDALAVAASRVGSGLPRLKPIIAAEASAKPGRLMPEIPLTSTLSRFAVGAIGLLFPPAMAALPEPKAEPGKTTPDGAQKKALAGREKAVAAVLVGPDAKKVASTGSLTAGPDASKAATKAAVANHFLVPGKRVRPSIAPVIAMPMTKGTTGRMTPVLQKTLDGRYQRMGLGMGSAAQTKCKVAARDPSLCP